MKLDDLEAIKARAEGALPGPWWRQGESLYSCVEAPPPVEEWNARRWTVEEELAYDRWLQLASNVTYGDTEDEATAEFIAHARTDIPALIAEVERLRAEVHV